MDSMDVEGQSVLFTSSERMDGVDSNSVTLVITSPPYWNARDYGGEQIGFNQSYHDYIESLNRVWTECIRVLQPNGKIAIDVQPLPIETKQSGFGFRVIRDIMHDIEAFFRVHDCFLSSMNFWDKAAHSNNVYWGSYPKPTNIASNTSFEQIYTFVKRGKTRDVPKDVMASSLLAKEEWRHWAVRCIWDDIAPVIKINAKGENTYGHGAPFPEDIPYRLIRMHTVAGEIVLDPFLGSGTTLKITRLTGRRGIGYEINPAYRDRITARIMESWTPPTIDEGYVTMGYKTIRDVLENCFEAARSLGLKDDGKAFIDRALQRLLDGGIISPAIKKHLERNALATEKKRTSTLESFF